MAGLFSILLRLRQKKRRSHVTPLSLASPLLRLIGSTLAWRRSLVEQQQLLMSVFPPTNCELMCPIFLQKMVSGFSWKMGLPVFYWKDSTLSFAQRVTIFRLVNP